MTVPKEQKATQQKERHQLIQDIKQQNPSVTDKQLSKYNIDDLRKIKMATAPKAETEKLSQVEQFDRDVRTGKFSQQYDTFRQPRMKHGGKMKNRKYSFKGRVIPDKGMTEDDLYNKWISTAQDKYQAGLYKKAFKLAQIENEKGGGKSISDTDFKHAIDRVMKATTNEELQRRLDTYMGRGQDTKNPHIREYQYGGMADMSAAPMIKQPQRRKRKASGFRTKYSKGGGVRSSKYKL